MRKILLLIALFAAAVNLNAQYRLREVTVKRVIPTTGERLLSRYKGQALVDSLNNNGKTDMFTGGLVYSFANEKDREAFFNKYIADGYLVCNNDDISKSDYIDRAEIDVYGLAVVKAPDNASFFVYSDAADKIMPPKNSQYDKGADGNGLGSSFTHVIFMFYDYRQMDELNVDEKLRDVDDNVQWGNEFYKSFSYRFIIDSLDANPEERLGLYPVVYEYESSSVFKIIKPVVVEGETFHENQIKRMGYNYKLYDKMAPYYVDGHFMRKNQSDTIVLRDDSIGIKRRGKHYTVNLQVYRIGYDDIKSMEEMEVDDGREKQPLRFIDFKIDKANINYARYRKEGKLQQGSDSKETNLFFKVGKAVLDPDDYKGLEGLQSALAFAHDIYHADNIYNQKFTIEGFASPEGNYQSNEDLARRRAEYLKNEILRHNPGHGADFRNIKTHVQPWTVVADTLERKGFTQEAEKIRSICAVTSDMNSQYAAIRALPYYTYINDNILPLLRIDKITVEYDINRVLTALEVRQSYLDNKEPYIKGVGKDAYEYFHLFQAYEDDFTELEPLARAAYNKFQDNFKMDSTNRPWTLAAYHLARCLIHRKAYDPELLKPYLFIKFQMNHPTAWDGTNPKPDFYAGGRFNATPPYNEEAVVLLQIEMLCNVGRYRDAKALYKLTKGVEQKYPTLGIFLDVFESPKRILDPAIRERIAGTSPWNKLVAYASVCGEKDVPGRISIVEQAARLLRDTVTHNKPLDPRVQYFNARLVFETLALQNKQLSKLPNANKPDQYKQFFNMNQLKKHGTIANSLIKAAMFDESFITEELRWDKYMPKGLWIAAEEFWKEQCVGNLDELELDDPTYYQRVKEIKDKEAKITE